MPLKRSPTPTTSTSDQHQLRPTRAWKSKQKLLESETAFSNTSEDDERSSGSNVHERSAKRKLQAATEEGDMQSAVAEMRILFANMTSKHQKQHDSLQSSITSIKTEIGDLGKAMEYLTQKYEDFEAKLEKLESEKQENRKYIQVLENRVEMLERKTRNSCIEIRNVDKLSESENKNHLCDMVTNLGKALKVSVQDNDIKDIYRVNTMKEANKPIIVEFSSVIKKEFIINSIRKFNRNKKKEDKLNSRQMNLSGPPKPVFVSESLTQKSKQLFYLARDFAKTNGYRYCWSSNGNIYMRKEENQPLIRVTDDLVIEKLKNNVK